MASYKLYIGILASVFALVFADFTAHAQVLCRGSLGDPVRSMDFGRGAGNFGPETSTDYKYVRKSPQDGEYTIASSTNGMNPGWYLIRNHTPGDPFGFMMIVNADETAGKAFYESDRAIDLCPNTTYEFAAWVANMLINVDGKKPNITFYILSMDNRVLGSYNTGDINNGDPTWKQYGFLFETTEVDKVKIRMVNNGPGGGGNDIALDDISFRACGPRISTRMNDQDGSSVDVCITSRVPVKLTADVDGTATMLYQWQKYNGTSWGNIPGENKNTLTVPMGNMPVGRHEYRLAVAEPGNFDSPLCRTVSPVMTINVNLPPVPRALNNGPVCLGDAIVLDVADIADAYEWYDPSGALITGSGRSRVIQNANFTMAGTYKVIINSGGCEVPAFTTVSIIPPPEPGVGNPAPEICEGSEVTLSATGGERYSWSPSDGLSATDVQYPVASPRVTTTYTVRVYAGSCFRTAEVKVIVHKNPVADAGPDKKVLLGYGVKLNAKASGDAISYFWTPETGLDDPGSLNPTVSPDQSTTYTLNVVSGVGCVTATDQVFVKVYDKVIVPNAFSPNGDLVNDVWNITAIDAFDAPHVKVMNRYGETVFENTGYLNAWDGKYRNADLPPGVYYYIIKLRTDFKPITGSVTLLR